MEVYQGRYLWFLAYQSKTSICNTRKDYLADWGAANGIGPFLVASTIKNLYM
jgi:hypothetical protein